MSIAAAVAATDGILLEEGALQFTGVCTDSRQIDVGQAFVALAGERFDGHDYCQQVAERGAALLVVERKPAGVLPRGVAVLQVENTRRALGQLARAWRRTVAPVVVAITGSVGKTTTKELVRALLAQQGPTHSNPGNLNNEIGLPLTLLAMPAGTRYLVVEMGMNAPGEIAYLTALAEPDVGVITCIAPVHLEGLGSLEAVARAKSELLVGLRPEAWAVVPGEEPLLAPALERIPPARRMRFGSSQADEVRIVRVENRGTAGSCVVLALQGEEVEFTLPLLGAHHAQNAAAAAAVGCTLGLSPHSLPRALETSAPGQLAHRGHLKSLGAWQLLDDCYNASPLAMQGALNTIVQLAAGAPTMAVLGSMLELGKEEARYHVEVGRHAAQVGLGTLITVGPLAACIAQGARAAGMPAERVIEVAAVPEAVAAVMRLGRPGTWILVKGSRGAHLEGVIAGLNEALGRAEGSSL